MENPIDAHVPNSVYAMPPLRLLAAVCLMVLFPIEIDR